MQTMTFNYSDETRNITSEVTNDALLWPELLVDFYSFLRGIGYVIPYEEFVEEFGSHVLNIEECEDCSE